MMGSDGDGQPGSGIGDSAGCGFEGNPKNKGPSAKAGCYAQLEVKYPDEGWLKKVMFG